MSWTDKQALETINKIKDEFKIEFFVETGTYKAINALVQSRNFEYVFTCENNPEYLAISGRKVANYPSIYLFQDTSPHWLTQLKAKIDKLSTPAFIYLDAHFYDATLPIDKRFVVLDELEALANTKNCIIAIHDFWNDQFTGITYDGIKLDINLVKEKLLAVNPNFKFYTNTKCNVYNEVNIGELIVDEDAFDNIKYANTSSEKRDRGILYAIPKEVNIDGLKRIEG